LHKHLFSNYTGRRPPLANASDTVTVMVDFAPVYLDVDDSGILEGSAWMVLMWKDPRLQFDPTEFGGIKKYNAPRWMVWMPDIVMHNR
jgi:nicotinic acetylcholine receptor